MEPEADDFPFSTPRDLPQAPLSPEQEREQMRLTYQLCRLGFGLLSGGLLLACFTSLLTLCAYFGAFRMGVWFKNLSWWHWIDAPIVWATLIGSYLLWGRWKEQGWQRRAGLLLLMCGVDLALWFLDHMNDLGLLEGEVSHEWLRSQIGMALGWAEFTLIANLACEMLAHLGVEQAPEAGRATRSLASTGAAIWTVQFLVRTDWTRGWPLIDLGIRNAETLLLLMGTTMIWTLSLLQVTALTLTATRQTSRVLLEMANEDRQDHLFRDHRERGHFDRRDEEDNPWSAPRDSR